MRTGLTVGQLARRAGVSADTIRYYERLGLVPAASRLPNGYRTYPEAVLTRITLVKNAQRFGFTLTEIAAFLRVRDRGGKPCHAVRMAADRLLAAMDRHLDALTIARDKVRETLADWDQRLARTPADVPARLLETLTFADHAAPPDVRSRPGHRASLPMRRQRRR